MSGPTRGTELLARLPQREPFRFVDEVLEVDDEHVVAAYTWRPDAEFYRGHFPGNPVTPGVLLLECMAQAGLGVLGLHLLSAPDEEEDCEKWLGLFAAARVDFRGIVQPGERVLVHAEKVFFRMRTLRCKVEMRREDGTPVASGVLTGSFVQR